MSTSPYSQYTPLLAGTLVGLAPMVIAYTPPLQHGRHLDPFDQGFAYAVWIIGMFVVSSVLAYRQPDQARSIGRMAGPGLPLSMMMFSAVTTGVPSMWPLALIVCAVIGLPPAAAGAWMGGRLGTGRIKRIGT